MGSRRWPFPNRAIREPDRPSTACQGPLKDLTPSDGAEASGVIESLARVMLLEGRTRRWT